MSKQSGLMPRTAAQAWDDLPPFLKRLIATGPLYPCAAMPGDQLTPEQVSKLAQSARSMSWMVCEWLLQASVDLVPERRFDEKPYYIRLPEAMRIRDSDSNIFDD